MAIDFLTEQNLPTVRRVAHIQQHQLRHALRVVAEQSAELDRLRGVEGGDLQQRLEALEAELSGTLAKAQTPSDEDGVDAAAEETKERKERTDFGPTEQLELDEVTERFELDEADLVCPSCGETLEAWEGQFETSELVDVIDVTYRLVKVERQKYRCECGGCVETAIGPERAIDGGRYSLEFAAKVAVDKYLDHLPLERQVRAMGRKGLKVTSQTLWDQLFALHWELEPIYKAIRDHILSRSVIGVDQTGWPNLTSKKAKKWQMWVLTSPDAVWHAIRDDKGLESWNALLGGYRGTVVCDALSTHGAGARAGPGLELAGCWAHIRRKFRESKPDFPEAEFMLGLIRELYDVELEADDLLSAALEQDPAADANALDLQIRGRLRRDKSADVLARMWAWMSTVRVLSSTSLGSAIKHTVTYGDRLKRLKGDPRIWLDNNPSERGLRGPVVGRRNHFGSKSRRGTRVAALYYTILETAKLAGVDPAAYLLAATRHQRTGASTPLMPRDYAAELAVDGTDPLDQ